jgi:hypothetical protein
MKLIFLAALALLQPSDRQFDLVCTETASAGRASTPEYRFRIDLDLNRWCEGDCARPREIAAVTADRYTLVDMERRSRTLRTSNKSWIDRVTGEHWEQNQSIGGLTQINSREGTCERAPYSGMPEPRL